MSRTKRKWNWLWKETGINYWVKRECNRRIRKTKEQIPDGGFYKRFSDWWDWT